MIALLLLYNIDEAAMRFDELKKLKEKNMVTAMVSVETQISEDIYLTLRASGLDRDALSAQFKALFALYAYQKHILSFGKAASFAGMNRWDFIDFLAENDTPVIDFDDEELDAEFRAVNDLANDLR